MRDRLEQAVNHHQYYVKYDKNETPSIDESNVADQCHGLTGNESSRERLLLRMKVSSP